MTVQAFSNWLYKAVDDSTKVVPGSYPYPANCGVLYQAGFTATDVVLYDYRPNIKNLNLAKPNIIIEIMKTQGFQKTSGGAQGEMTEAIFPAISVLWIADHAIHPGSGTAPAYTDFSISQAHFRKLLNALKKTLVRSVYSTMSLNNYGAANWPLTDPDTGDVSRVVAEAPLVTINFNPPESTEGDEDPFYIAYLECQFKEGAQVIPPV